MSRYLFFLTLFLLLPQSCLAQTRGIAANYAGDKNISQDSHVLFAEDFGTGTLDEITKRWTDAKNTDGKVFAISSDVPVGSASKRSLQITATAGVNDGGYLYKRLPKEVEKLYARFYVKFAEDADYIHHFVAMGGYHPATNWPQGGAGIRPRGDDRIFVGIEPHSDNGKFGPPGFWSFYNYWQDMKISADGKYWGAGISPEERLVIPKNRWQCVEVMVKLNSVPEKADGELALWLDGKQIMHIQPGTPIGKWTGMGFDVKRAGGELFEGFRWRNTTDLKLNYFWLLHYVTENAARAAGTKQKPTNRVWFANVVVATEYIGQLQPLRISSKPL